MLEDTERLRILIADGHLRRVHEVAEVVTKLGHEAIPRETDLEALGQLTSTERPHVTIVTTPGSRVWTDDFSDVFSVFRWRSQ